MTFSVETFFISYLQTAGSLHVSLSVVRTWRFSLDYVLGFMERNPWYFSVKTKDEWDYKNGNGRERNKGVVAACLLVSM